MFNHPTVCKYTETMPAVLICKLSTDLGIKCYVTLSQYQRLGNAKAILTGTPFTIHQSHQSCRWCRMYCFLTTCFISRNVEKFFCVLLCLFHISCRGFTWTIYLFFFSDCVTPWHGAFLSHTIAPIDEFHKRGVLLAACCELAADYSTLPKLIYVYEHKT